LNNGVSTEQCLVLLLLRVAIALAAYRRHDVVETGDLEQAARMLARHVDPELIDVRMLIA
jgi:hypothetical protein